MTNYKTFKLGGTTRPIISSRSKRSRGDVQQLAAWGQVTSECWGPVGARKQLSGSYAVSRTCPRVFGEVAELTRHNAVSIAQGPKTKRGFTPFCKGLGIHCNGFWGCGALGPHKCNRKWPKSPYKRSRDSRRKYITPCIILDPAYLIGKCVDQRESALAILWVEALKRREI